MASHRNNMQANKSKKLSELVRVIAKMPLNACCIDVIPEFGVNWKQVTKAVQSSRLPMVASSVAEVLCQHSARNMHLEDIDEILGRLRLKCLASQSRKWHVIRLLGPSAEVPVTELVRSLPQRVLAALRNGTHRNKSPKVQSITRGDLFYLSIQFVSAHREGASFYLCTPPGAPVALVSALSSTLLKSCVAGLGYAGYENAQLHGKHVASLLRIADPAWTAHADHLSHPPEYCPGPTLLSNGIDYTHAHYDEAYVDSVIGPNPPLLTDLDINSTKMFFDRSKLDKAIKLSARLKTDDVCRTLKTWVGKGALAPTSDLFMIFHQLKSNTVQYGRDDSD